jgi:glycosyltransferase involved in cell wall biosynthesis
MSAVTQADRFPVVLFTNSFIMGGMEEHLLLLGRELVRRAFPVAAICSPGEEIGPLRAGLAAAGVEVFAPGHRADSRLGFNRRLRALLDAFRRYPGAVLHIHSTGFHNGDLPMLAARMAGVRAIVRTEHVPPQPPITPSSKLRVRLRDRFVNRVICVSEQNRVEHIGQLGRDEQKFQVVLNGCDLSTFTPDVSGAGVREELGIDSSAPVVGAVARLGEERKGIAYFLDMAQAVAAARADVRFVVVGDGPLRTVLERQADHLGVGDRVVFAGERKDVPRLVAAMNVFVMPSLYEGCQYTLMEAMAMAKPIVSTPAGVAPDVIEDGVTGRMVPFADGSALAVGVLDMLAHPDAAARMGRTAREVAVERFSVDGMVDNLIAVYRAA